MSILFCVYFATLKKENGIVINFGMILKQLRGERNLYQKDVASFLGCTSQAISAYEKNDREPDLETLKSLANYYGVTVDYLLGNNNAISSIEKEFPEIIKLLRRNSKITNKKKKAVFEMMKTIFDNLG